MAATLRRAPQASGVVEGFVTSAALGLLPGLGLLAFGLRAWPAPLWWGAAGVFAAGCALLVGYVRLARGRRPLLPWRALWGLTIAYNAAVAAIGAAALRGTALAPALALLLLWAGGAIVGAALMLRVPHPPASSHEEA